MATHRVFIKDEIEKKQIGKRLSYSYKDGQLYVYNGDTLIWQQYAEKGNAFVILCYRGKTVVKDMIPPKKVGNLIGWLLGFTKHNRAHQEEEFEAILEKYRQRYEWEDYIEWEYTGKNYHFMRCNRKYEEGYHNLVALIDDNIKKEEVLELIPFMVFPVDYVEKILWKHFAITKAEYNNAMLKGMN